MDHMKVAEQCRQARSLIRRDGFKAGTNGWTGHDGWCLEGALFKVLGMEVTGDSVYGHTHTLNFVTDVGRALRQQLGIHSWTMLHHWNDLHRFDGGAEVLRLLEMTAEYHEGLLVKQAMDDLPDKMERVTEKVAEVGVQFGSLYKAMEKFGHEWSVSIPVQSFHGSWFTEEEQDKPVSTVDVEKVALHTDAVAPKAFEYNASKISWASASKAEVIDGVMFMNAATVPETVPEEWSIEAGDLVLSTT